MPWWTSEPIWPYKLIQWCKTFILKVKKYLKEMQLMKSDKMETVANCFSQGATQYELKLGNMQTLSSYQYTVQDH